MESLIYLDTHVIVWLYTDNIEKIPADTLKQIIAYLTNGVA